MLTAKAAWQRPLQLSRDDLWSLTKSLLRAQLGVRSQLTSLTWDSPDLVLFPLKILTARLGGIFVKSVSNFYGKGL